MTMEELATRIYKTYISKKEFEIMQEDDSIITYPVRSIYASDYKIKGYITVENNDKEIFTLLVNKLNKIEKDIDILEFKLNLTSQKDVERKRTKFIAIKSILNFNLSKEEDEKINMRLVELEKEIKQLEREANEDIETNKKISVKNNELSSLFNTLNIVCKYFVIDDDDDELY